MWLQRIKMAFANNSREEDIVVSGLPARGGVAVMQSFPCDCSLVRIALSCAWLAAPDIRGLDDPADHIGWRDRWIGSTANAFYQALKGLAS